MFVHLKDKLHNVQQDLSAGLKTLSTRAKEVKISRREEISSLRKDIPSVPRVCNHEAGAELLDRYQQIWSELHREIEASAEQAEVIDTRVQQVFLNYERRAEPILQFQKQLQDLPRVVENIQYLTAAIGKLEADFEEVESMLTGFEDLNEHCDLLRNKHTQVAELARYTQQKLKEEELMKVRLQEEYEQSVLLKEESQKAGKMERQKAFEDVFAADMDHYRTHGEMQRVLPEGPRTPTDISSIENFEITVDDQDQEALNDFLGGLPGGVDTKDEVEEEEEDEPEMNILEVIDEESERDETEEKTEKQETESAIKAEVVTSQDQRPQNTAVEDGQSTIVREEETTQEHQDEEDDDDEAFDTPDEGSDAENN